MMILKANDFSPCQMILRRWLVMLSIFLFLPQGEIGEEIQVVLYIHAPVETRKDR